MEGYNYGAIIESLLGVRLLFSDIKASKNLFIFNSCKTGYKDQSNFIKCTTIALLALFSTEV